MIASRKKVPKDERGQNNDLLRSCRFFPIKKRDCRPPTLYHFRSNEQVLPLMLSVGIAHASPNDAAHVKNQPRDDE